MKLTDILNGQIPLAEKMAEDPCWKGYEMVGTKQKDGKEVPNCVPINKEASAFDDDKKDYQDLDPGDIWDTDNDDAEDKDAYDIWNESSGKGVTLSFKESIQEAEYQGRKVTLNKPVRSSGGSKKFHVYVKDNNGKVKKVSFGDPNMKIKKHDPERRKSFRARHNCDNPGPKTSARYWSCKAW